MRYTDHVKSAEHLAARKSHDLPSVDDWLAGGGEIDQPTDPPRPDYTMGTYEPRSRIPLAGVK